MDGRTILSPGRDITLFRSGSGAEERCTIGTLVGHGGACLCYNASMGAKSGRLKEFHPLDSAGLPLFKRAPDGSLHAPVSIMDELCGEFCRCYEILENAKLEDEDALLLNNFLPPCELLWGSGGSVYVWTPDDKQGVSFARYLEHVRSEPSHDPEHKLYNIISTLATLTDCVRVFHRSGLLHLDIKPENFLVLYDGRFNINPAGISLFDVNTLYPLSSRRRDSISFSAYYSAPELYRAQADNRSDIYSIGMMLLRAIVFSEDGKPADYSEDDYAHLENMLSSAPLMAASDTNSNVFLRHTLAVILKRCLAPRPERRYDCCEELMDDLRRAAAFLIPEVAGVHLGHSKRLAVLDAEPCNDKNSAAVIHELLFRCPPESKLSPDENEIRVLLLGAGTYGQKFMDICLQACQIPGKKLHIKALSHTSGLDREVYLLVRPALGDFVDIDSADDSPGSYGHIDFKDAPLSFSDDNLRRDELEKILGVFPSAPPHFVFVSLGDDGLNESVASALAKHLKARGADCGVHYVVQDSSIVADSAASPVYVNRSLSAKAIDPRLEKWAFNAHLCWMGGENADLNLARKKFRSKYNYESSLSYALSLPAKLRSVGIDLHDAETAAEQFSEKLLAPGEPSVLGALVALEHRRWVLSMVCSGWSAPKSPDGTPDYMSGILRGDMKDSRRREHPCIVKSGDTMPLGSFSPEQWANPGAWDDNLDELDTLSVRLHRLCLALSEKSATGAVLGDISLMRRKLAGTGEDIRAAFEVYSRCLQDIIDGSAEAASAFDSVENGLKKVLSPLPKDVRKEILHRAELLRRQIFPLLFSLLRKNYKKNDEDFIRLIPFVLTHNPDSRGTVSPSAPAAEKRSSYVPAPITTDDVLLPPELIALRELIAENVHEVWAANRLREGWVYGEYRDSQLKTSPDLVPYTHLPESEKEYDRKTALETLKLILKLGYRIEKADTHENTFLSTEDDHV